MSPYQGDIVFENEEDVGEPTLAYDSNKTALVGEIPTAALLQVIKGDLIE